MPFELLEHTADVGVKSTGATFDEALAHAVRGLFAVIAPGVAVEPRVQHALDVRAPGLDRLVVDVLDDVNFLHLSERFLAADVAVRVARSGDAWSARVEMAGETYDPVRHGHLMEIKATTFHGLVAEREPARIEVIFDI